MRESLQAQHLHLPVLHAARQDYAAFNHQPNVREAMEDIRTQGLGERIIYFYVVDDEQRLIGVLPSRRLLTAPLDAKLVELMDTAVIAQPNRATLLDACQLLIRHRFLALPVVDEQQRLCGLVALIVWL